MDTGLWACCAGRWHCCIAGSTLANRGEDREKVEMGEAIGCESKAAAWVRMGVKMKKTEGVSRRADSLCYYKKYVVEEVMK